MRIFFETSNAKMPAASGNSEMLLFTVFPASESAEMLLFTVFAASGKAQNVVTVFPASESAEPAAIYSICSLSGNSEMLLFLLILAQMLHFFGI